MLLFSVPVLACPVARAPGGSLRDLTVVCRREHFLDEVSVVRKRLAALRLRVGRPRAVSDAEYSACLSNTLEARLGPHWNPVGGRLVQGRNFIDCGTARDAVRLEVNVRGETGEAWLGLSICRLRLAPLRFSELDVTQSALQRYQEDPLCSIPATCIGQPFVHVLPTLKRGMVMEISKTIPAGCPFPGYTELRRHWKNMYGYRLPQEPPGHGYVGIYFELMGGRQLCYPWTCLTASRPTGLRCLDPQAVAVSFLGHVALQVSTVCEHPSPVTIDGLLRPVVALQTARPTRPGRCSDTEAGTTSDSDSSLRHQPNLRPLASNLGVQSPRRAEEDSDEAEMAASCTSSYPPSAPLSLATPRDGTRPNVSWNILKRAPCGNDNKENVPPEELPQPPPAPHRPVFRARIPQPRAGPGSSARAAMFADTPLRPWFRPSATSSPISSARTHDPSSSPSTSTSTTACLISSSDEERGGPGSAGQTPPALPAPTFRVPAHRPIFLPRLPPAPAPQPRVKQAGPGRSTPPPPRPGTPIVVKAPGREHLGVGTSSSGGAASQAAGRTASPAAAKKTATKRQSSEPVQVPNLASVEAAKRASIPMLLAWLREKGVPCRTKDKKGDLVDKVAAKLAQSTG